MFELHFIRKCLLVSATLLVLTRPSPLLRAHEIKPEDHPKFNQEDLKKLRKALADDTTSDKDWIEGEYECTHFARDVQYNLFKNNGIETVGVPLTFTEDGTPGKNHQPLKTTIRDKDGKPTEIYIEPQNDKLFYDTANLLEDLRSGHTVELNHTGTDTAVYTVEILIDGEHTGAVFVPTGPAGGEKEFTVDVYVKDRYERPVKGQKVTVKIKHADGTEDTLEDVGVTDSKGVTTGKASTKTEDYPNGLEVEAVAPVLTKPGESRDSKDPTGTKKVKVRIDNKQTCVPKGLDGVPPRDPIYVSTDGEVTQAYFTYYNWGAGPVEFEPILECGKNDDGSDVLDVSFDPAIVYIEPDDCANVRADIVDLTAPAGDTIVAKLHGVTDGYEWVYIKVFEPIPQIVIDPFGTPTSPVTFGAAETTVFPWTNGTTGGGLMLGGERDLALNVLGADPLDAASIWVDDGALHITQDPTARSRVITQYDGPDGSWQQARVSDGLNSLDLTDGDTQDGFLIRVLELESTNSVTMTVIVFTTPDDSSEKSVSIAPAAIGTDVQIQYSDLAPRGAGADMTNVNGMLILFGFPDGMTGPVNLAVDGIWTTPKEGTVPYTPDDLKPSNPYPADGALHRWSTADLSWDFGPYATSYDVYFSASLADVSERSPDAFLGNVTNPWLYIGSPGCPHPDGLVAEGAYYWLVIGRNDLHPDGSWPGDIWSFTLPPAAAWNPGPADGATSVDPDAGFTWNSGLDAVLHLVHFGTNADSLPLVTTKLWGDETFHPGPLDLDTDYYWRVDEQHEDGTVTQGNRWSFTTIERVILPEDRKASNPSPFSGAIDVDPDADFTWDSGIGAVLHRVHFGTEVDDLPLVVVKDAGDETFDPGTLDWETSFYWRIDEEQTDGKITPGDVWSLETAPRPPLGPLDLEGITIGAPSDEFVPATRETTMRDDTGAGIGGNSDQFSFRFMKVSGDVAIAAGVDRLEGPYYSTRGGVTIRETLEPGSKSVTMAGTPDGSYFLLDRPNTDGPTGSISEAPYSFQFPFEIRLVRQGDTFTGYYWCPIGYDWLYLGQAYVDMPDDVLVGTALASGNNTDASTAVFRDVTVTGSGVDGDWGEQGTGTSIGYDVGGSLRVGTPSPDSVTVAGQGHDFWGRADTGFAANTEVEDNAAITARVAIGFDSWDQPSLMFRQTRELDSSHASVTLDSDGVSLLFRGWPGGETSSGGETGPGVQPPHWLKLVRVGDDFTAYDSPDGKDWTKRGSETVPMDPSLHAGLALTSRDGTKRGEVVFDNFTIELLDDDFGKKAWNPFPADGATGVPTDVTLRWISPADTDAESQELRFGTDPDALQVVEVKDVDDTFFDPGPLDYDTDYYWRVDENLADGTKVPGDSWTFKTVDHHGGLKGEYYHWSGDSPPSRDALFGSDPVLRRIDSGVDFVWGQGPPDPSVNPDQFAVRLAGWLDVPEPGDYTLGATADDGIGIWLDGQQVIDAWLDQSATWYTSPDLSLTQGLHPVRLEYYDNTGDATVRLFWKGPGISWETIPPNAFFYDLKADLNDDGEVNFYDLEIMTVDWVAPEGPFPADLDGDGDVDFEDYAIYASQYQMVVVPWLP
ncbi:MAG: hypothetical protein JSU70_08850 [Phycisphaerales bacterium]|nr:MAG: hypothetical protein JSU70_08850 [Phycisphaerales bacterium]